MVTMVYIVLKWKILPAVVENGSKNTCTSVDKSQADDIVTNINPAYKTVRRQRVTTANHEFEEVRDTSTTGVGETTTELDAEQQESCYENQEFELKMKRNVAYQSSTTLQIPSRPLHLNVEYCKELDRESRKVKNQATCNDDKDYI
jgi:hypothetical protein